MQSHAFSASIQTSKVCLYLSMKQTKFSSLKAKVLISTNTFFLFSISRFSCISVFVLLYLFVCFRVIKFWFSVAVCYVASGVGFGFTFNNNSKFILILIQQQYYNKHQTPNIKHKPRQTCTHTSCVLVSRLKQKIVSLAPIAETKLVS